MSQGIKTSFFTFTELINVILSSILKLNPKPSLIYKNKEGSENTRLIIRIAFYINDSFVTHDSFKKQYMFLKDHLLLRFVWAKLYLSFLKLSLFMTKVLTLREIHKIDGAILIKSQNIVKLLK